MKKIFLILLAFMANVSQARATFEFEEDHGLPIVFFSIVADVGAIADPDKKLGLANLTANMLLRGTQKHNKDQFNKMLEKLGGQLSTHVLAEGTVFNATILEENLEPFLKLVDETLTKPKFASEEIQQMKKEIEGQILDSKGRDQELVAYHFSRFFFGTHPYGRPIIGLQKTVSQIQPKDILNFYAEHYGRNTVSFLGTGSAKSAVLETWFKKVQDKLGAIHPEAAVGENAVAPQIPKGNRCLLVDKPKATQTQVYIGGEGIRPENPNYYAVELGNYIFGGHNFESRMMTEIREKRGWSYGAYNYFRMGRQPRQFTMSISPKTSDTIPALELTLKIFDDFRTKGITNEEFNHAHDSMVNSAAFDDDTAKKRTENHTIEQIIHLQKNYFKDYASNIAKQTYDNILPALKSFFGPKDLTIVMVGDASKLQADFGKISKCSKVEEKNYLED